MSIRKTFENLRTLDLLIKASGLSKPEQKIPLRHLSERLIISPDIANACLKLYKDGHTSLAVETAFKVINNHVKSMAGLPTLDGMNLMQSAFSINNPKIKLNRLKTTSEKDEQLGYMNIFGGSMTGIRNPRAHEHNYLDSERQAFELLILADHLMQKLNSSTILGK